MIDTVEILKRAASVKGIIAGLSAEKKNEALKKMAEALVSDKDKILKENEKDIERSRGVISEVMIDRLRLTPERIDAMAKGILDVAALPDPVGRVIASHTHQNGMVIEKTAAPMGVVAIIYESRPNVTSDAAALALKSSNVCVLRGGKEAYNSAYAIVEAMRKGLLAAGLPREAVSLVEDTTRESARVLMEAVGLVDLLIPRGGAGLIRACVENARVPCIQTGTGICHIFVDASADFDKALSIIENAKTSRPSVCNAEEVLLVHKDIADKFLPEIKRALVDRRIENGKIPVELRLDSTAAKMIDGTPATDEDFDTEFLDYILAVGVVSDVDGAIEHISRHSTGHSEAIITESQENADKFTKSVDSAALYVNASTRFTDGGEFGLGCEMGISTQKLHARGPMGISELTTYKYIVHGNGQVDRRIENGKIPVELRLDSTAAKMIDGTPATDEDFDTEFLDYILAVGVVSDVDGAIEHISRHSTGHSEAIITESQENADKFTKSVDSAALYVNASTRFTDGGEFGLGCEMGISTQKLHARGPMGISELTTYKYIVHGNGQVR